MTPREKTDLRNRISEEAAKRFWGPEVHYLASSVADVIDSMPETEITTEQAWNKIAEGYPKSPEAIANTCNNILNVMTSSGNICVKNGNLVTAHFEDEEKTKIPKWLEEYVLNTKGDTVREKLYNFLRNYDAGNCWMSKKHISWVRKHKEIVTEAFLVGYEVDEPLYIMPVPYTEEAYYFEISLIGVPKPTKKWEAQEFTLDEINEYFPKIAEFKEEVGE